MKTLRGYMGSKITISGMKYKIFSIEKHRKSSVLVTKSEMVGQELLMDHRSVTI